MLFDSPLIEAHLLRHYQRFLAGVELADPPIPPNTGSILGYARPGSRVWLLRKTGNAGRKYPLAWELAEAEPGILMGINTGLANRLVREGVETGIVAELQGYGWIRAEVRYGKEKAESTGAWKTKRAAVAMWSSRTSPWPRRTGRALFPDAVTTEGPSTCGNWRKWPDRAIGR